MASEPSDAAWREFGDLAAAALVRLAERDAAQSGTDMTRSERITAAAIIMRDAVEEMGAAEPASHPPIHSGERRAPILTTRDAAKYSGLAYQTFRNLLAAGNGPRRFKQGRLNVFYAVDVDGWLAGRVTDPDAATIGKPARF
ncbi:MULTISPECIES: AlpA family transcriptional regulator [unclassified Microbacterium]|uniref:helix-turn-helix transcriptional regulator n=1 Tax=unclassified Microbacterium TaxID=2609290 RepID=UPI0011C37E87|nr:MULTISPECIES: helix-turn-helix domain-containing protein [unclassified Microbacterium]MBT2483373.1 hypothetical protein [Microbacterium sp. ISL-108]